METTTTVRLSKTTFNKKVSEILRNNMPTTVENPKIVGFNTFKYAAMCESNFQRNLENLTGKTREWTFFSDISIGEWFGIGGVADTLRRCFKGWLYNEKAIAELLISICFKSYEMNARKLTHWKEFYANVYEQLRDLVLQYYDIHDRDAAQYVRDYLD